MDIVVHIEREKSRDRALVRFIEYIRRKSKGGRETHVRPAGFLGVAAHLGQEFVVSQPVADRVGNLLGVLAERAVPSLDNIGDVSLLRTR